MPSPLSKLRLTPLAVALQAAMVARDHWQGLDERDRRRLSRLVRDSRGWPGNLTSKEREELTALLRRLDLPGMGREMLPLARGARRSR